MVVYLLLLRGRRAGTFRVHDTLMRLLVATVNLIEILFYRAMSENLPGLSDRHT